MSATVLAFLILAALCDTKPHFPGVWNRPIGKCPEINGETPTYLADRFDRTIFYECNGGRPIKLNCPNRLVFNTVLNVCDFSRTDCEPSGPVGNCPIRDSVRLTFLRDGANMSVFYICRKGEPIKFECAEGLIFNPRKNCCTHPQVKLYLKTQ